MSGAAKAFGWIGVALLAIALFLLFRLAPAPLAGGCTATGASAPVGSDFQIVAIRPDEFGLGGGICVVVANVVDASALSAAKAKLSAAGDARDAAVLAQRKAREELRALPPGGADATAKAKQLKDLDGDFALAETALADADTASKAIGGDRKFALFLDGKATPALATAQAKAGLQPLFFSLDRVADASSTDAGFWRKFMGTTDDWSGIKTVDVAVGAPGTELPSARLAPAPPAAGGAQTARTTYSFVIYRRPVAIFALLGLAAIVVMIALLARTTLMLREPAQGGEPSPRYSLARTQLAFWLVLTIAGFIDIWIVTGQWLNVVSQGTFVLLGISGAAAAGASAVGVQQANSAKAAVAAAQAAGDANAAVPPNTTRGFFYDLISDGVSPHVHRWQILGWTLVLGAIYIWNIVRSFTLTDFDGNLLALAGVVNGVYVAMKTQEG